MQTAEQLSNEPPYVISSPRQLKALSSPMRHKILGAFDTLGVSSVARLAVELDCPAESLYYHIHSLLKVGLIVRAGSQPAGKRPEALYRAISNNIRLNEAKRTPAFLKAIKDIYRAALRAMERNLNKGLENEKDSTGGPRSKTQLRQLTVQLNQDDIAELKTKMDELEAFLRERHSQNGSDTCSIMMAYANLGPSE